MPTLLKLPAQLLVLAIAISLCSLASVAQTKRRKKISRGERLLTALINSTTLPGNFGDDGVFFVGTGTNGEISPDVIRFLRLGKTAIPLLIGHLDDKRLFKRLTFCCLGNQHKPRKVTVGEVALDILTVIVGDRRPMFDLKCLKAELGGQRCISEGFYEGKTGRRNWQKAYRAGRIRYQKYDDGSGK